MSMQGATEAAISIYTKYMLYVWSRGQSEDMHSQFDQTSNSGQNGASRTGAMKLPSMPQAIFPVVL